MSSNRTSIFRVFALALTGVVLTVSVSAKTTSTVATETLRTEVRDFFAKEVAVHYGAIDSFSRLPDRVNGSIATGEFTWGSFVLVVAAQSDIGGSRTIAGRDTARSVAEMGLYEARKGGKAFSQLYAAQALRHFGTDLNKNAVWQSMNDAERKEWTALLDATRIYDPVEREVINLPENYLGVAARIAAYAYEFGVMKDRAFLDSLIERAAKQFTDGALYSDDDLPNGRYDRYSNEYVRFCWFAAETAGRKDIVDKLRPSMNIDARMDADQFRSQARWLVFRNCDQRMFTFEPFVRFSLSLKFVAVLGIYGTCENREYDCY